MESTDPQAISSENLQPSVITQPQVSNIHSRLRGIGGQLNSVSSSFSTLHQRVENIELVISDVKDIVLELIRSFREIFEDPEKSSS